MPAINIPMFVETGKALVLFNTVDNVSTATPLPTVPGAGMDANSNTNPYNDWYYVNNENVMTNGYIYVMVPYRIDENNMYVYDDNTGRWRTFSGHSNCIELIGRDTSVSGDVYTKYRFGSYDEDFAAWENTQRKVSFYIYQSSI